MRPCALAAVLSDRAGLTKVEYTVLVILVCLGFIAGYRVLRGVLVEETEGATAALAGEEAQTGYEAPLVEGLQPSVEAVPERARSLSRPRESMRAGEAQMLAAGAPFLTCGPGGCPDGSEVCFAAGTPVVTPDGPRPIETLEEGDLVVARDPARGVTAPGRIVRTKRTERRAVLALTIEGSAGRETLRVTPEHPFFVPGRGFVAAGRLAEGDPLWPAARVLAAAALPGTTTVFNIEVAGFHTYRVGASGVLVHNDCVTIALTPARRRELHPQQVLNLRTYGHAYEVALAIGAGPSYEPSAAGEPNHVASIVRALHRFYSARTDRERADAITALRAAEEEHGHGEHETRKARIVDLALRFEAERDATVRARLLREMATLFEQMRMATSAVDHLRIAEALTRYRTENRETIRTAAAEAGEAATSYLRARTSTERAEAIERLGRAARSLPAAGPGTRNVFAEMRDRAEAHDALVRIRDATTPTEAAAALTRLRTLAGTNPVARRALDALAPGGATRVEQVLAGLGSGEAAVRERTMTTLRRAVDVRPLEDELRALVASGLASGGFEIGDLLDAERTLVREQAHRNQVAIETAYERFLTEPTRENLQAIERLVRERRETFSRNDMDFVLAEARLIEVLHRLHSGDGATARGDLERLGAADPRVARMLASVAPTLDDRARLTIAELRRRLPTATALIGERRGFIVLSRLGATSPSRDYEDAVTALRAAASINPEAASWLPWAEAHRELARIREGLQGSDRTRDALNAIAALERMGREGNPYAQAGLFGLLAEQTERNGRPIHAPRLPLTMNDERDRVGRYLAEQLQEGTLTLTDQDARALAEAFADAGGYSARYPIERILRAAMERPARYTYEGYRRWGEQGGAALRGITDAIATRPRYGPRGRSEARALADLMIRGRDHAEFESNALRLGPAARNGNPGAIRVLANVLANSTNSANVDAAYAMLLEAMRVHQSTVSDEVTDLDYLGRARNPGAIALLLVEGTWLERGGRLPNDVFFRIRDALVRTRTAPRGETEADRILRETDQRRAIRALFASRELGWLPGSFAETALANRTPQLLAALRENADLLTVREVQDFTWRVRNGLRDARRAQAEVEVDIQTIAALGSRVSAEDLDALGTALTNNDRTAAAVGRALVQIMARNPNAGIRARAESMFTARPAWPGMGAEERDALLAYVRSNGTDLAAYGRIQRSAYAAGLPRPIALILRDMGIEGSDAELIVAARMLERRLGGDERTRRVLSRIGSLVALSPTVRQEIFGDTLGSLNVRSLVRELMLGPPASAGGRALLVDGSDAVERRVERALDAAYARRDAARRERQRAEENQRARMTDLTRQTGRGPTWYQELYAFWPGSPTEEFTDAQRGLLDSFRRAEQRTRDAIREEGEAIAALRSLTISSTTHTHARALSRGDFPAADRTIFHLFGEMGNAMERETPVLWDHLRTAWPRLYATHQAARRAPPLTAPGTEVAFDHAMIASLTRGLSGPERAQLLRQIDGHPTLREALGLAMDVQSELQIIQELYQAAVGGPGRDAGNVKDEYVNTVKERARALQERLAQASAGGRNSLIQQMRDLRDRIRREARDAAPELRGALEERARLLDQVLRLVDPDLAQVDPRNPDAPGTGHRVGLDQLLRQINSPDFGPNTWREWARRQGPIIAASIIVAVAAVVTVMSFGAGSPLLIAAVGSAGAILGAEVTREGLYHLRQAGVVDIGQGRSRYGGWRDGDLVYDPSSGRYVQMDFWRHVAGPITVEFIQGTITSLAVMGVGAVGSRIFSSLGSRLPAAVQANRAAITRLNTGTRALTERVAGQPAQQAFVRRFLHELVDESIDEVSETTAERMLETMLKQRGDALGLAGAGLVAFGRGVLMSRRGRSNQIALNGTMDATTRDMIVAELRRAGNTVRVDRNVLYVTAPNGSTFVMGSNGDLDALAPEGPSGQTLNFECVDGAFNNILRRLLPDANIPDGTAAGFNRLTTFAAQVEAMRSTWRTITSGGDIESLGQFRTRAELEAFIRENPDLFPPGTQMLVAGHNAEGGEGHMWSLRVDESGRVVADGTPAPAWDRAQLRLFRARRSGDRAFGAASTALEGLDPARANAQALLTRVLAIDAMASPSDADTTERARHVRSLRDLLGRSGTSQDTAFAIFDYFASRPDGAERTAGMDSFLRWFDANVRGPEIGTLPEGDQAAARARAVERAEAFAMRASTRLHDPVAREQIERVLGRLPTTAPDGQRSPREVALRQLIAGIDVRSAGRDINGLLTRVARTLDLQLDTTTGRLWREITPGSDLQLSGQQIAARLAAGDLVRISGTLTVEQRIQLAVAISSNLTAPVDAANLQGLFGPTHVDSIIRHQDAVNVRADRVEGGHDRSEMVRLNRAGDIVIDTTIGTNGFTPIDNSPGWSVVAYRMRGETRLLYKTVFDPTQITDDARRADAVAALNRATLNPGGIRVTRPRLGEARILVNIGTNTAPRFVEGFFNGWEATTFYPININTERVRAVRDLQAASNPAEAAEAIWRLGQLAPASADARAELERYLPGGYANYAIVLSQLQSGNATIRDAAFHSLNFTAPPASTSSTTTTTTTTHTLSGILPGVQVRVRRTSGTVEDNWRIVTVEAGGTVITEQIGTGTTRRTPATEILDLNPTLVTAGAVVQVRRGTDAPTDGWILQSHLPDGRMRLVKDGVTVDVAAADVIALNRDRLVRRLTGPRAGGPVTLTGDARTQSEAYRTGHRVEEGTPIADGFADGGRGMTIDATTGRVTSGREVIVVDRTRDPALQRHLAFARALRGMPAEARARRLAEYVDTILSRPGGTELAVVQQWETNSAGREVLLGEIVENGAGVCRHRALLYKVLGDEAGLDVAFVRGNVGPAGLGGGHAWNEVVINGRRVLVDPYRRGDNFHFRPPGELAMLYRKPDGSAYYTPPPGRSGWGCSAAGATGATGGSGPPTGGALVLLALVLVGRGGRSSRGGRRPTPLAAKERNGAG